MSSTFDAFHLPATESVDYAEVTARALTIRVPRLTPSDVQAIVARLRDARTRLLTIPLADIVHAIDAAAAMLTDPHAELYAEAMRLLPAATGYSPQMCAYILEHMAPDWRKDALDRLLIAELGNPAVLDRFIDDPNTDRRITGRGPDPCLHVFSGNVPGVAVTSLIRALLVRGASLGKTALDEPVLPVLFARALRSVAPAIADTVAVTYWASGQTELLDAAASEADVAVVYGGSDAVRALRRAAAPNTRVVAHGPRLSIGFVGRGALRNVESARKLAASIARATATFDQQGCVSPHAVFVQLGAPVEPRELAEFITEELDTLERTLPRARLTPEEAAAVRNAKTRAEFAAYAGAETTVLPLEDRPFAVIYDARETVEPSCLNRVLYVKTFAEIHDAARVLQPHHASLQSAALAGFGTHEADAIARLLVDTGITRITDFDRLPFPTAAWHHDGSLPLRELIRYADWERSAD